MELPKKSAVPLEKLQSSEPVIHTYDQQSRTGNEYGWEGRTEGTCLGMQSTEGQANERVSKSRDEGWYSVSQLGSCKTISDTVVNYRASTPKENQEIEDNNRDEIIEQWPSTIGNTVESHGENLPENSNHSNKFNQYFGELEESLEIQERIVEDMRRLEMSGIANSDRIDFVAEREHVPEVHTIREGVNFSGFGEDESVKKGASARLEALNILKRQVSRSRNTLKILYSDNNMFLRRLWQRQYMCSETRFSEGISTGSEASGDVGGWSVVRRLDYGSGIVTRSRGQVENFPNVQPKTIEYKNRDRY